MNKLIFFILCLPLVGLAAPAPPKMYQSQFTTNPPSAIMTTPTTWSNTATSDSIVARGLIRTTNLVNVMLNVRSFAPTNWTFGVTDDTPYLQNAFDTAGTNWLVFPNLGNGNTYKTTGLTAHPGQQVDFMGSVIICTTTNFAITLTTPVGSPSTFGLDNRGPVTFKNGVIIAHNGIQLNQQGNYSTVFQPQQALTGVTLQGMQFTGDYGPTFTDPNKDSGVVPTDGELQAFGMGLKASKAVDMHISQCLFTFCGIGIYLDGCDTTKINNGTRVQACARWIHMVGHDTWGGQVEVSSCDFVTAYRMGAIYVLGVDPYGIFNINIHHNFLETPRPWAKILWATNFFSSSFTHNAMPNTGDTNTAMITLNPRYGMDFSHNEFVAGGNSATVEVSPALLWTPNVAMLGFWSDNNDNFPRPNGAGFRFTPGLKPYSFNANNYESVGGAATGTNFPWVRDPFITNVWSITTNNPPFLTTMQVTNTSDRRFMFTFTGRRTGANTNGFHNGFIGIDYVEDQGGTTLTTNLYTGDLLFSLFAQTNSETRSAFVEIPRVPYNGNGHFLFTLFNDEVQYQSIEGKVLPNTVDPYLLSSTNYIPGFFYVLGNLTNAYWTNNAFMFDPVTGRPSVLTNLPPMEYFFPLAEKIDRQFTVDMVGRTIGASDSILNIYYIENSVITNLFSGNAGFPTSAGTNTVVRSRDFTIPDSFLGTGKVQFEFENDKIELESVRLVPFRNSGLSSFIYTNQISGVITQRVTITGGRTTSITTL